MVLMLRVILILFCANIALPCFASIPLSGDSAIIPRKKLNANKLPFVILRKAADGTIKMISVETPAKVEMTIINSMRIEASSGSVISKLKLVNQLLFPFYIPSSASMKQEAYQILLSLEHTKNKYVLFNLAHCLLYGTGVERTDQTFERGINLLRESINQGYIPAKILLAHSLYVGMGNKNTLGERVEGLKHYLEVAKLGSDFCIAFIGYNTLNPPRKEDRDIEHATVFLSCVKERELICALLCSMHLMKQNREKAVELAIEAEDYFLKGRTNVPIKPNFIEYLKHRIQNKNNDIPVKPKNKGRKSKKNLEGRDFISSLETDLKNIKKIYENHKNDLEELMSDKNFPIDPDFNPSEALYMLKSKYKEFEQDWIKGKDFNDFSLSLDAFKTDLFELIENNFIAEQHVRNKQIPQILCNRLKNIKFHSDLIE